MKHLACTHYHACVHISYQKLYVKPFHYHFVYSTFHLKEFRYSFKYVNTSLLDKMHSNEICTVEQEVPAYMTYLEDLDFLLIQVRVF